MADRHHPPEYDAPHIERVETIGPATVRLRANSKRTQKDGWAPADITVEYTGDPAHLPPRLFHDRTVDLYDELTEACIAMNRSEGR